jgi:hypothetical protein
MRPTKALITLKKKINNETKFKYVNRMIRTVTSIFKTPAWNHIKLKEYTNERSTTKADQQNMCQKEVCNL